jgi:hypothetical protein
MLKNSGAAIASAATLAAAGALCLGGAAAALADVAVPGGNSQPLGSPVNIGGQAWTVSNLKQSSDAIPYQPRGTLWEATATDEAVQGGATPIVSDLNATSPRGQTYRVLYQVATPQGINPAGLAQGQKTTGKVYFDVTGDNPNAVVYREASGQDLATWVQPTAPAGKSGGHAVTSGTGGQSTATPGNKPATSAGNSTGTPAGSQGTPLPAGSQGTPATDASPAAAPAGGPGTPPPAGNPEVPAGAPAPAAVPGAPAAGPEAPAQLPGNPPPASAGTPAVPASPAAPAPTPSDATPPGNATVAPTGSQGSPG